MDGLGGGVDTADVDAEGCVTGCGVEEACA